MSEALPEEFPETETETGDEPEDDLEPTDQGKGFTEEGVGVDGQPAGEGTIVEVGLEEEAEGGLCITPRILAMARRKEGGS